MAILFFTEGDALVNETSNCEKSARTWKEITQDELSEQTERFMNATRRAEVPADLRDKLIIGSKFPIKEIEMLIKQNPEATHLQMFYGMDNEKHFHYITAASGEKLVIDKNTIIVEDCCRIPPNTILNKYI